MASTVGNKNTDDLTLECIVCGRAEAIALVAHRNKERIVGFIGVCPDCREQVYGAGFSLLIPKHQDMENPPTRG